MSVPSSAKRPNDQRPAATHSRVLEALDTFRRRHEVAFTPPDASRGGEPTRSMEESEKSMAEAVRADHAFFSTCGSSLSVKGSPTGELAK